MPGPSKRVKQHLTEEELDEAIDDAQSSGETRLVRRLCLLKNLYAGDSITEAAHRVGVAQPTASRWTENWNESGVDGLRPNFGGGRPSKLTDEQRAQLVGVLEKHQPLPTEYVRRLIDDAFDVSYSHRHVPRLLNDLGLDCAISRQGSPARPDDAEEALEERFEDALAEIDEDVLTDGGVVGEFPDEA